MIAKQRGKRESDEGKIEGKEGVERERVEEK